MKLAIADPPYPPMFGERFDTVGSTPRVTARSRALRWYGDGPKDAHSKRADFHPEAAEWDDLSRHHRLMLDLIADYDGWAIATTPDGLGAYHPLPISAHVMAWHRPRAMPGAGRLTSRWEAVIVFTPEGRRTRRDGQISDVLTVNPPTSGFVGAKPAEWTRWVLEAMGYDPDTDTVTDIFPGSGAVSAAADGMLI